MAGTEAGSRRRRLRAALALAAAAVAAAACEPFPFVQERSAVLEVTSTRPDVGSVIEVAAAEDATGGPAWPEEPVSTPYRRRVSVSRAAVMVRRVSGPAVRVRLRSARGGEQRHEVQTTTSDVALVTGSWRYLPGSWVSAAGF